MSFSLISLWRFLFFPFVMHIPKAVAGVMPALYVFGDSNVDAGNNNNNAKSMSYAKANWYPYGVDFPKGVTGRFTNGLTIADYFARFLGLGLQPAVKQVDLKLIQVPFQGLNYASGSAGVLPLSGTAGGNENINMGLQVELFKETILQQLPFHYKTRLDIDEALAKSIFLVVIGGNDFALNYANPMYNSSRIYTPDAFINLILTEFESNIKAMYQLGARKFVISDVAPLGCLPLIVSFAKPTTRCVDALNGGVQLYNGKLAVKIKEWGSKFGGSSFVLMKFFDLSLDMILHPTNYGTSDSTHQCCVDDGKGPCTPNITPCKHRNTIVFWDSAHFTQAVFKVAATRCLTGSSLCSPVNLQQLSKL